MRWRRGGDCLWLDEQTLAVGLGFRTNAEGLAQLKEALGPAIDIVPVELPYFTGPDACLHLMSFISMVDHDLAVVYPSLMPVPFWQLLTTRGITMVEVPAGEFATMGPNVLAPRAAHCVMLEGNPVTRARLEAAGCRVQTYRGAEISLKSEGGPTCLTRPVWRGPVVSRRPTQSGPEEHQGLFSRGGSPHQNQISDVVHGQYAHQTAAGINHGQGREATGLQATQRLLEPDPQRQHRHPREPWRPSRGSPGPAPRAP